MSEHAEVRKVRLSKKVDRDVRGQPSPATQASRQARAEAKRERKRKRRAFEWVCERVGIAGARANLRHRQALIEMDNAWRAQLRRERESWGAR